MIFLNSTAFVVYFYGAQFPHIGTRQVQQIMSADRQVWRTRVLGCDQELGLHVIWTSWVWMDFRAEDGDTLISWMLLDQLSESIKG